MTSDISAPDSALQPMKPNQGSQWHGSLNLSMATVEYVLRLRDGVGMNKSARE